jgi:hypothetical protein
MLNKKVINGSLVGNRSIDQFNYLLFIPPASTGLISIAIEACLDLKDGSFNRNMPRTLVGLLSQSLDLLRRADSLSSIDMMIDML